MAHSHDATSSRDWHDSRTFRPTASLQTLKLRAALLQTLRRFFESRGYWETETPILSHDVLVDAYLEPFRTRGDENPVEALGDASPRPADGGDVYLQTSPEFGMKRLLAAGAQAIYQITRAMRKGEVGRHHNPEFTMAEWYRVGQTHREQMVLVEELIAAMHQAADERSRDQAAQLQHGWKIVPPPPRPFERLSYDEAFERHAGMRVFNANTGELHGLAQRHNVEPPPSLDPQDRDGWLNLLLAELVEPRLGRDRPTFLYDYPATQSALARIRAGEPPVAERFELYWRGLEICNGYHELTDPEEFRARISVQNSIRKLQGLSPLPSENRLLDAMQAGLPDCAGVALGFDRLLMVLLGAGSLAEVMAFPFDRA